MCQKGQTLTDAQLDEAQRLSKYLTGRRCSMEDAADYFKAVKTHGAILDATQKRLWRLMMRSSFVLRIVDAAFVFTSPASVIRKRIFIMFCVLETSSQFSDIFLPVNRPRIYMLTVALRAFRAVLACVAGVVFVKLMGYK